MVNHGLGHHGLNFLDSFSCYIRLDQAHLLEILHASYLKESIVRDRSTINL